MKKVELNILRNLSRSEKSFWELLSSSPYPLYSITHAISNLYRNNSIKVEGNLIRLTDKGKEIAREAGNYYMVERCNKCEGKGFLPLKGFEELLKEYRKITKERPEPKLEFFQGYMRDFDVIMRVAIIDYFEDLRGKEFVLIGDDDLLSLALALTQATKRIVVLDADERIGDYIKEKAKEYGFGLEFIRYNVSNPPPKELVNSFDVFSSEPLESLSGLHAFLVRGVGCLRKNGVGYFGLTTLEASRWKWFNVEKLLLRLNCCLTDIIRDFSIYPLHYKTVHYENFVKELPFNVPDENHVNWYRSALIRLELVKHGKNHEFSKHINVKTHDRREDITYPS